MNDPTKRFYEFDSFRIDPHKRLLLRDNKVVLLKPKVFDTLLALVENSGRVLEKEELMQKLWPDSFVEEANLTVNISALRKTLGEGHSDHQFILTVPGRGYRFVSEVHEVTGETTELVVQESKVSVVIEEEEVTEGEKGREGEGEKGREGEGAMRREQAIPPISRSPALPLSLSLIVVLSLLVGLLAGLVYWWRSGIKNDSAIQTPPSTIKSIAVLPFKALDAQSQEKYFGVGMADVLITRLSNLNQLVVRPTSSVLRFGQQDSLQAGKALQVDSVLDGSIQQIGDRVRVTVRLVRTSDGQSLWAYQCDESCVDVFQLQDTISQKVTEALALRLTSDQQQRLTQRYTNNAEAYQEYIRGRFYTLQFSANSFQQAVTHLNQAIELDPAYALAWAGLADAYTTVSDIMLPPREALAKAAAAAEKALALDDTLAEAHAALGHVKLHKFDRSAEQQFRRALELNPNSFHALLWYGEYWAVFDPPQNLPLLKRVEHLDPLSPLPHVFGGFVQTLLRQPDQAVSSLNKAVEMAPKFSLAHNFLSRALFAQGKSAEALAAAEKAYELAPLPMNRAAVGSLYALTGRRQEAEQVLTELQQMASERYVSPYDIAMIYVGLGDKEQAFAWLEKAREDQSEFLGFMKWHPALDSLRADPRFGDLLRRVGLLP